MALEKPSERWALVVILLAVLAGVSQWVVKPVASQLRVTLSPDRERDKSSGLLQVFRGVQMSLADMCFNKSTVYQHSGILYRAKDEDIVGEDIKDERRTATDAAEGTTPSATVARKPTKPGERPTTTTMRKTEPDGHGADEHGHQHLTIIPLPEDDFRGIIGDVERQVKPFELTHVSHVKPEEALPWLRLATWINPDHEMAWVATAFWLQGTQGRNPKATSQAITLLEQARALNPPREGQPYDKQGLIYELGHLYLMNAKNPAKALEVLEPVIARGENDFAQLDAVQRDWLTFSFRDAVEACKKLGRHDRAVEFCKRGLVLFPDDRPLRSSLRREQQLLRKGGAAKPANSGPKRK